MMQVRTRTMLSLVMTAWMMMMMTVKRGSADELPTCQPVRFDLTIRQKAAQ